MLDGNSAALRIFEDDQAECESFSEKHKEQIEARALDIASLNTDDEVFVEQVALGVPSSVLGEFIEDILRSGQGADIPKTLVESVKETAKEYFDDRAYSEIRRETY